MDQLSKKNISNSNVSYCGFFVKGNGIIIFSRGLFFENRNEKYYVKHETNQYLVFQ